MGVTVEFMATKPAKIIHKDFKNRGDAIAFMCNLAGSNFLAYLDDKTLALYVGEKISKIC